MSRAFSASEFAALVARNGKTYYQTELGGVTIGSIVGDPAYDPFVSGSISASIDQPVQQASFNLHLGKGSKSLSPWLSTGAKTAGGDPLLRPGRSIVFKTATVLPDTSPDSAFRKVFEGRIDSVDLDPNQQDLLVIKCRDTFSEIQDRWIDQLALTDKGYVYGFPIDAARVDLVMQQILNKVYGSTGFPILAIPILKVLGTPALGIGSFWQEGPISTLEAIRRQGLKNGWDLRGRWDLDGQDRNLGVHLEAGR